MRAWSPYLQRGLAIVRLKTPGLARAPPVECVGGQVRERALCELPTYDRAGDMPRGKCMEIPEIPVSA